MKLFRCLAPVALTALTLASVALSTLLSPLPVSAQQEPAGQPPMSADQAAMMQAWMAAMTPGAPHASLAQRAGKWTAKVTLWMEAGAPPTESAGTVEREMLLGGRVMLERFHSDIMGMPMEGMGLSGYDNVTAKYWSTWTDNMSTALTKSEGTASADGTITYLGAMVDPATKVAVPTRFVVTSSSPDRDTMEMYETRNGQELRTMQIVYDRVK